MSHHFHDSHSDASQDTEQNTATAAPNEKPFLVELRQEPCSGSNSFVPAATLQLNASLRTSGLLHFLEPDALKNLLYLITFLSPEGRLQASLFHLAEAMRLSQSKAKSRMQRLSQVKWQDEPLVIENRSESGYVAYSVHPRLISYQQAPPAAEYSKPPGNSRERVVEYSRRHYARPRAEVEKMVARQLGQDENETEEERRLRYRLENQGLTSEQARSLILAHDRETIERQLEWLPYRNAKNPSGYLVAAIEGDYDEPRALRDKRALHTQQMLEEQALHARALQERRHRDQEFHYDQLLEAAVQPPVEEMTLDDDLSDPDEEQHSPDTRSSGESESTPETTVSTAGEQAASSDSESISQVPTDENNWINLTPDE